MREELNEEMTSLVMDQLKSVEGWSNEVYIDSGGAPTIGMGHLLTRSERRSGKITIGAEEVEYSGGLTDEQVYALALQDSAWAVETVFKEVAVPLTIWEYVALVSFAFNIGRRAFTKSTLLKRLNRGDYLAVPHEMRRWKYDNGVVVQGLINRREAEIRLWNGTR